MPIICVNTPEYEYPSVSILIYAVSKKTWTEPDHLSIYKKLQYINCYCQPLSSHVCVRRFSQDKDISAIKIKPGTLQRFQFFFSAYSPPFHLGFWNNHLHQNGTLKSIYQMDPPLEKVLKLSVDFSFTSSRAIFRIHARLRQLVAQLQEY